jgi:hypothetical protein
VEGVILLDAVIAAGLDVLVAVFQMTIILMARTVVFALNAKAIVMIATFIPYVMNVERIFYKVEKCQM